MPTGNAEHDAIARRLVGIACHLYITFCDLVTVWHGICASRGDGLLTCQIGMEWRDERGDRSGAGGD